MWLKWIRHCLFLLVVLQALGLTWFSVQSALGIVFSDRYEWQALVLESFLWATGSITCSLYLMILVVEHRKKILSNSTWQAICVAILGIYFPVLLIVRFLVVGLTSPRY